MAPFRGRLQRRSNPVLEAYRPGRENMISRRDWTRKPPFCDIHRKEQQMKRMLATACAVMLSVSSHGLADHERVIAVTGSGEISVEPDIAEIQLGIFEFDKDLLAAKREADNRISTIVTLATKLGVAPRDITTTQLSVRPMYDKDGKTIEFLGYEITRSLSVTLRQISKLNELLEQSITAGANRIESIDLRTSKEKDLKDQVRMLAITNAKEVAGQIATGFDAKLGKVMSVSVNSGFGDMRFNMLSAPVFSEATYQPGVIAVSAEIDVVFALQD